MPKARHNHHETALVIASGLLVLWLIFEAKTLIFAALAIALIGAFVPRLSRWIHWLWYKLADAVGWLMSRVLLTVVYFLVVVPFAFLSRLFGKRDPLRLRKPGETNWVMRDHVYEKGDLERPW